MTGSSCPFLVPEHEAEARTQKIFGANWTALYLTENDATRWVLVAGKQAIVQPAGFYSPRDSAGLRQISEPVSHHGTRANGRE